MLLTDDQIAADLRAAGYTGSSLVTQVAIDLAESGGDPAARGDVGLQDGTWGPSIGLAQIRSLKAQRGTGGIRDELANYDPLVNSVHAYAISGGGQNFKPWSTFNSGAYRAFVDRAQRATANVLGGKVPIPATDVALGSRLIAPNAGPGGATAAAGLSGGSGGLFDAVYRTLIFGALATGAIALVVLGGFRSVSSSTKQTAGNVVQAGATVAAVA